MLRRRLQLYYPHFPSESDFTHSVLSSGDIQSHARGGELYLLARFAQEWPRLQAGGLLLPDLVEFYQWLHTALGEAYGYCTKMCLRQECAAGCVHWLLLLSPLLSPSPLHHSHTFTSHTH